MIREDERTSDNVYNQCAQTYDCDIYACVHSRLKFELVAKYADPSQRILDVGCANGLYMAEVGKLCALIEGVDINDMMLSVAEQRLRECGLSRFCLHKQSASQLEFPDGSFDLVYSFSTLLLVPDTRQAIAEAVRVLKPGGIAVLDITGRYNLSRLYWGWYYRRHGHFGVNAFAYGELARLIEGLGAQILESPALGFTDQWKYIPGLHKFKALERFFHEDPQRDRDYRISNHPWLYPLANRWYTVVRKRTA